MIASPVTGQKQPPQAEAGRDTDVTARSERNAAKTSRLLSKSHMPSPPLTRLSRFHQPNGGIDRDEAIRVPLPAIFPSPLEPARSLGRESPIAQAARAVAARARTDLVG